MRVATLPMSCEVDEGIELDHLDAEFARHGKDETAGQALEEVEDASGGLPAQGC